MINKNQNEEFKSKENCCSSVSTYLIKNYPDIPLQKFDSYATAKEAFENGTSVAWANDNTEVIAFSLQNKGYTVGILLLEAMTVLRLQSPKEMIPY